MQDNTAFLSIDPDQLEDVSGGRQEGVMGAVRAGLLGASLLMGGGPAQMPPRVEPIRIEMPIPSPGVTQR